MTGLGGGCHGQEIGKIIVHISPRRCGCCHIIVILGPHVVRVVVMSEDDGVIVRVVVIRIGMEWAIGCGSSDIASSAVGVGMLY